MREAWGLVDRATALLVMREVVRAGLRWPRKVDSLLGRYVNARSSPGDGAGLGEITYAETLLVKLGKLLTC